MAFTGNWLPATDNGLLLTAHGLLAARGLERRVNGGLQAFGTLVAQALAVDEDGRRAADAELLAFAHIARHLVVELAAVERRIEPGAVQSELRRVLFQLRHL